MLDQIGLLTALALSAATPHPQPAPVATVASATGLAVHYRTARIDGVDVFYREAGPPGAPTLLLLHGFPSSSSEFRNIIPALADRYHVIAPDYPGFGNSGAPNHQQFAYTFAHLTDVVEKLLSQKSIDRYAIYIQDFGAPVGLRLALRHPDRVSALVVQNGNAYVEGLRKFWDPIKAYWADGSADHRAALRSALTPKTTRWQYYNGAGDPTLIDPDAWTHDQALLERAGTDESMLDLFYDYRTNVALYPEFQKFLRQHRPPTLIIWGAKDEIFPTEGARPYLRDVPGAEFHLIDAGHFALESKADQMVPLMLDFLARTLPGR